MAKVTIKEVCENLKDDKEKLEFLFYLISVSGLAYEYSQKYRQPKKKADISIDNAERRD